MSKIHFIYKTVCLVTGKYYIGMHSTVNENDYYMGSGKVLRRSIQKHGVENHRREVLQYAHDRAELIMLEKSLVTLDLLDDPLCMNLKEGGLGGGIFTSEVRAKIAETFSKILHQQGERNSCYGTRWITNEVLDKKIGKDDPIPRGWRPGRAIAGKRLKTLEKQKAAALAKTALEAEKLQQAKDCYVPLYDLYMREGFKAVQEAVDYKHSLSSLIGWFVKVLPEYVPRKRQPLSEEAKQKISAALVGKAQSREHAERVADMRRGKKWYHSLEHGTRAVFDADEEVPESWVAGMGPRSLCKQV